MANKNTVKKGTLRFKSASRLIHELGERLVANIDVAITELIKNAYDADSPDCHVWHEKIKEEDSLNVLDSGHGMSLEEFEKNWMTIATGEKNKQRISRIYKRTMTGAKGVGRFAVQVLGKKLTLQSVADDPKRGYRTRLIAKFDWESFSSGEDIEKIKVPYELEKVDKKVKVGTHLKINDLTRKWDSDLLDKVKGNVLRITTAFQDLDSGSFSKSGEGEDPGFEVYFTSPEVEDKHEIVGDASKIIEHAWICVDIDLKDDKVKYTLSFRDRAKGFTYTHKLKNKVLLSGLHADIRYLPKRKGVFSEIPDIEGIDRRTIPKWVKENSGIGVFDHGFRMRPYGYPDDDWLHLSADNASSFRGWRSSITKEKLPYDTLSKDEKFDPTLFLPGNHQLIGAVFLESFQGVKSDDTEKLIPAMDREGYVENAAFVQLVDIIRAGMEFLAYIDKKDQIRRENHKAEEERKEFKADITKTIQEIESNREIPKQVKTRLVQSYKKIETQFDNLDQYHKEARENIERMSLLGTVAGFMTHENDRLIGDVEDLVKEITAIASKQKNKELQDILKKSINHLNELRGYREYTKMFVTGIHEANVQKFKAKSQVDLLIEKFGDFAKRRNIDVNNEIVDELLTSPVQVTVYSGVLLNLYTNALKAFPERLSANEDRKITFRAWNEPNWHIVQVMDNGVGIPPNIRERIWDPLFSTTSMGRASLGSGMGLGLAIIQRLIQSIKGKIELVDPPAGFKTCFEVRFREGDE